MSSLLPLGESHADQTNRLRRHHAAEAAQGALTVLRAHCLPANEDTGERHGPWDATLVHRFEGYGGWCWIVRDAFLRDATAGEITQAPDDHRVRMVRTDRKAA